MTRRLRPPFLLRAIHSKRGRRWRRRRARICCSRSTPTEPAVSPRWRDSGAHARVQRGLGRSHRPGIGRPLARAAGRRRHQDRAHHRQRHLQGRRLGRDAPRLFLQRHGARLAGDRARARHGRRPVSDRHARIWRPTRRRGDVRAQPQIGRRAVLRGGTLKGGVMVNRHRGEIEASSSTCRCGSTPISSRSISPRSRRDRFRISRSWRSGCHEGAVGGASGPSQLGRHDAVLVLARHPQ